KLVPISIAVPPLPSDRAIHPDVLYGASDNAHNEKSMRWLVSEVLPLLDNVAISVVGKICRLLPDHPSLRKLGIVDDLSAHYAGSRITVCPMESGTGIKIKVLESLVHSLPVVTTRRGGDGLYNKANNGSLVADNPAEFTSFIYRLLSESAIYH